MLRIRKGISSLAAIFLCHLTSQAASVVDTPYTVATWQWSRAKISLNGAMFGARFTL
jgi:hypothetical protein